MRVVVLLAMLLGGAWAATLAHQPKEPASNELDVSAKILREQDASLPPNQRYPSAVLFGRTCGGTIISPTWILTAAHCTLFRSGLSVLAGTNSSWSGGVRRRIKRLVVHPLFTVGPYWLNAKEFHFKQMAANWDFMLAELEEALPLDGVSIAAAELDDVGPASGARVGYAGYGTDHFKGVMSHDMHAMDMEVRSDEQCSTMEQYNPRDMLCAQGIPPRNDSGCNGDSGSGLVRGGRLLGVLSWAEDDASVCEPGKKVVFARVAAAREWIRQVANV